MGVDFSWHPWRALPVRYPAVVVSCRDRLPDRLMGLQQGHRIWLCRKLTQAERRCTLTHELVHRERGPVPHDLAEADREEQIVNDISARRLVTLPSLVDGLRWTRDPHQLAEHLRAGRPAHAEHPHGVPGPGRGGRTGEQAERRLAMDPLTDQQRAILDVERQFWRTAETKETAIRELGLSPIRYYQLLVGLIRSPAALAADPVTVKRLLRLAERRRGI